MASKSVSRTISLVYSAPSSTSLAASRKLNTPFENVYGRAVGTTTFASEQDTPMSMGKIKIAMCFFIKLTSSDRSTRPLRALKFQNLLLAPSLHTYSMLVKSYLSTVRGLNITKLVVYYFDHE